MKTSWRTVSGFLLLSLASAANSAAAQINPGFEATPLPYGTYGIFSTGTDIGGWTVVGPQTVSLRTNYTETGVGFNGSDIVFNAHSGLIALDLTAASNQGTDAGVTQTIATQAGVSYDVSFWVGRMYGPQSYYVPDAVLDLSIDGGARQSFTNSNATQNSVYWEQFLTSFVATGSSTVVTFFNGSPVNGYVGLDDVSITSQEESVTPEPASVLLVGTGLFVLSGVVRRRSRC